jgi:predicted GH43/DUF377 family glycosyl hydrolase
MRIAGTVSFQEDLTQIVTAADIDMRDIVGPGVIRLKDGRFRMFLQASNQSGVDIISLISADGNQWDPEPGIRIQHGAESDIDFEAGEPDVYLDPDGKYYMAYTGRQPISGTNHLIHTVVFAVSEDGLVWSKLGRYYTDPENRNGFAASADVMILNGVYLMYYTGAPDVILATSSDGINWTRQNIVFPAAHDSTVALYNGIYYMFFKLEGADKLLMGISSDGRNWSPEVYQVIVSRADGGEVADVDLDDPSAILYPDGSLRVFLNSRSGQSIFSIKPEGSLPEP